METLNELKDKALKRITEYIGFDAKEIFDQGDYIAIFGGAVRDSIANMDIHDVDIICLSKSAKSLRKFIMEKYDYQQFDLYDPTTLAMYKQNSIIDEPWTFIGPNRNIIQIIRPTIPQAKQSRTPKLIDSQMVDCLYEVIRNVDISCCGVLLEKNNYSLSTKPNQPTMIGEIVIEEASKNAILHCLTRIYRVRRNNKMYEISRTTNREQKLSDRGWQSIKENDIKQERQLKLMELEFKPEYNYKIYEDVPTPASLGDDADEFFDLFK